MRRIPLSFGLYLKCLVLVGGTLLLVGALWFNASRAPKPRHTAPGPPEPPYPLQDPGPPEQPGEIGVRALVGELVDLMQMASLPDPPFVARLASSYDRRSHNPSDPLGWFANDDWVSAERPNYVRVEEVGGRREYVLLDVAGPGAVVRIWSATPTGTLSIYLDGEARAVIQDRLEDLLSGNATIPRPFAYVAAGGYNAYFPLPFRTACKVTVDDIVATDPFHGGPLEKFYYHINYRLYPQAAKNLVRTFRRSDIARALPEISRVASVLAEDR